MCIIAGLSQNVSLSTKGFFLNFSQGNRCCSCYVFMPSSPQLPRKQKMKTLLRNGMEHIPPVNFYLGLPHMTFRGRRRQWSHDVNDDSWARVQWWWEEVLKELGELYFSQTCVGTCRCPHAGAEKIVGYFAPCFHVRKVSWQRAFVGDSRTKQRHSAGVTRHFLPTWS